MGANFQTMTLAGTLTRNQVEEAFALAQDQDRYENGHSYSGGFGMATGISFPPVTFRDVRSADDWLDENCVKWEDALCVTYTTADGVTHWRIGALCSS